MKQYAEHGKVGVCHALRADDLYKKTFSGGYPYMRGNLIVRSSPSEPIYSYGKNYTKRDNRFALFVWTTEGDTSVVEEQLDSLAKKVTNAQAAQVSNNGSYIYL